MISYNRIRCLQRSFELQTCVKKVVDGTLYEGRKMHCRNYALHQKRHVHFMN